MGSDISPFRVGQTYPPAHYTFRDSTGATVPMPQGTVFTMYIYNPETNITVVGTGTWSAVNLNAGQADYQWSAADSATVGTYEIFVGFVTPSGYQGYTDITTWQIIPVFYQQ